MKRPALVLNPDADISIEAAHQHLRRINSVACLLVDEMEKQLSANVSTPERKRLHSALGLSLVVEELSGELLEHLNIIS